ncbi:MAG: hypothetical protein RL211_2269 [Pseudomonadota bacterium]|jgi:hypothetical protein
MHRRNICDAVFVEFVPLTAEALAETNEQLGITSADDQLYTEGEDVCPSCGATSSYSDELDVFEG